MLNNYQLNKVIARRKAIASVLDPTPSMVKKEKYNAGVLAANTHIENLLKSNLKEEVKKISSDKMLISIEKMSTTTSISQYSYWLGALQAFGKYCYTGTILKIKE